MTEPTWSTDRSTSTPGTFIIASLALASPLRSSAARSIGRWLLPLSLILVVGAAVASASSGVGSSAPDAAPPLTLTNEHLGMSLEQIEASQTDSLTEPAPGEVESRSELDARADSLVAAAEAAKQRALEAAEHAELAQLAVEAAEAGLIPGVAGNQQGAASYESCVEASIRRDLSFADSDRLCRAVFGEATE